MIETINQELVNKVILAACNVFRGIISPSTYKDFILTMLFLKSISDKYQDRDIKKLTAECELQDIKASGLILPPEASFNFLYNKRYDPGNGKRIDMALDALARANWTTFCDQTGKSIFPEIFFDTDALGEGKDNILIRLLEVFSWLEIPLHRGCIGNSDIFENAYDSLIGEVANHGGAKKGEFFTPSAVSGLITEILAPQPCESICDPACGSGSLLIKCGRMIQDKYGIKKYDLFGQESLRSTWAIAKMNMVLHEEYNHKIEHGDTLRDPKLLDANGDLMRFDIALAALPFFLDKWSNIEAEKDRFGRFYRGIPAKNKSDYAFILHMIETLKPKNGRMGVVVPHGVLFRGSSEGKIRENLIEENLLDAVIGLPEKLFNGTNIPVAILIFKKEKTDTNVLFIDSSREFKAGKTQNILTHKNINKIVKTYHTRNVVSAYSYVATLDELRENEYNLNISRYIDIVEAEKIDLFAIQKRRVELKVQLAEAGAEVEKNLKALGYNL